MNEICIDLFWFTLILHFFAHSLILLMSGFMLFHFGVIWPYKFSLSHTLVPCVCWSERRSLRPTVDVNNLSISSYVVVIIFDKWNCAHKYFLMIHCVFWTLTNTRKARFCTSRVKPIL
jgi:hypothetical protein